MNIFGAPKWVRIILVTVTSLLVWGIVGFIIGGWPQALTLGIVGGLAMSIAASIPILRGDNKGSQRKR